MQVPFVVPFYAGLFALIYLFLGMRTSRLRTRAGTMIGAGNDLTLRRAIRAHGNFGEWVPFILLMLGFAEAQHWSRYLLHVLCILLLVGRLLHAYGISRTDEVLGYRITGISLTILVMIVAAIMLIYEFFLVLPTT
jgi:uncharacterized protein